MRSQGEHWSRRQHFISCTNLGDFTDLTDPIYWIGTQSIAEIFLLRALSTVEITPYH